VITAYFEIYIKYFMPLSIMKDPVPEFMGGDDGKTMYGKN
jgi:hypothetical protein